MHTVEKIIVSDTGNPSSSTSRLARSSSTAGSAQLRWEQPGPGEHPKDRRVRSNLLFRLWFRHVSSMTQPEQRAPEKLFCLIPGLGLLWFRLLCRVDPQPLHCSHTKIKITAWSCFLFAGGGIGARGGLSSSRDRDSRGSRVRGCSSVCGGSPRSLWLLLPPWQRVVPSALPGAADRSVQQPGGDRGMYFIPFCSQTVFKPSHPLRCFRFALSAFRGHGATCSSRWI